MNTCNTDVTLPTEDRAAANRWRREKEREVEDLKREVEDLKMELRGYRREENERCSRPRGVRRPIMIHR